MTFGKDENKTKSDGRIWEHFDVRQTHELSVRRRDIETEACRSRGRRCKAKRQRNKIERTQELITAFRQLDFTTSVFRLSDVTYTELAEAVRRLLHIHTDTQPHAVRATVKLMQTGSVRATIMLVWRMFVNETYDIRGHEKNEMSIRSNYVSDIDQ